MNCGIYKITNTVNGKIYIGQSVDIKGRWHRHKWQLRANKHSNTHLQAAWNKYTENSFTFEILAACQVTEFEQQEKHFIALYKSADSEFGYNKTIGGEVLCGEHNPFYGKKHTPETCIKFSQRTGVNNHNYGVAMTEEQKEKISASNTGHSVSEATISKIKEARASQPVTQNMLAALAKHRKDFTGITGEAHSAWGCKHSKEAIEKSSKAKWKTVLQVDQATNEVVKEYASVKEAALAMGFKTHANISSCCTGSRKTAGGFGWRLK